MVENRKNKMTKNAKKDLQQVVACVLTWESERGVYLGLSMPFHKNANIRVLADKDSLILYQRISANNLPNESNGVMKGLDHDKVIYCPGHIQCAFLK